MDADLLAADRTLVGVCVDAVVLSRESGDVLQEAVELAAADCTRFGGEIPGGGKRAGEDGVIDG